MNPEENYDDDPNTDERDKYDEEVDEMHEIGCCFPGECIMPGEHFRYECHTVQMAQDAERAMLRGEF